MSKKETTIDGPPVNDNYKEAGNKKLVEEMDKMMKQ